MSRDDFLLEIGCEEIPARMLDGALVDLEARVTGILDGAGLAHGASRRLGTPRRLSVIVEAVAKRQDDRDEEVLGPPAKAAIGADGNLSKAALGFAQKMGVDPKALATVATPKGDYLAVRRRIEGKSAAEILAEALPRAVSGMSFPKTMRWGDGTRRFVRPVHWIVALLGGEAVPVAILGVPASATSRGHRILGAATVPIPSPARYEETLLAQGVVAARDRRRSALSRRLVEIAGDEGVRPVEDAELLDEVTDLVEHPGAVLGAFPVEFLALPREVLVTTLRHHQKAFSTETDEGISHRFLIVADHDRDPEGHIRKGAEWVVVGRLEDARFFFQEDMKLPMASRLAKLEQVTFHAKAGSYADKSRRIETIAAVLAQGMEDSAAKGAGSSGAGSRKPGAGGDGREGRDHRVDIEALRHAARYAKCDLTTGLVGEFPELQGVGGGLYMERESAEGRAAHSKAAAAAVYDQYLPAGAGSGLPRTHEGALLALADRLDTLVVLARVTGLPTGSKDPFALRRAAHAIIRLGAETPLPLTLDAMLDAALAAAPSIAPADAKLAVEAHTEGTESGALEGKKPATASGAGKAAETGSEAKKRAAAASGAGTNAALDEREQIRKFLLERLEHWLKEKGARYDTVNAVLLARGGERAFREPLPTLAEKVFALERVRELPDAAALVEIHRRCRNILQQAEAGASGVRPDVAIKEDPEEAAALSGLGSAVGAAETAVHDAVRRDAFEDGLQQLVRLRPPLSRFFDHVLVMHPDETRRRDRLDLVRRTALLIEEVADLKQISISKDELQRQLERLAPEH